MSPLKRGTRSEDDESSAERVIAEFREAHADQLAREERLTSPKNPNGGANADWLARLHARFGGNLR